MTKVQGEYDIWDWIVDVDGNVIQVSSHDMVDLPYEMIERHATKEEIIENGGYYEGAPSQVQLNTADAIRGFYQQVEPDWSEEDVEKWINKHIL